MDAAGYDPGYKKWRYDDLSVLPEPFRYVLVKDKEDAFQNLKRLMEREDVTELVNACDAGRRTRPSGRVLPICAPARSMTRCISPPSAARKRTGSSGSMPQDFFLSSTAAP